MAEDKLPPVVFLMGPTAAGKTSLAVRLVQDLPCEIVSVDSAMVYRGMDIGTGKPDHATLAQASHRLIDIRDPEQTYSAAAFREDALREIHRVHLRDRTPLLVGGTGLYFKALQYGLSQLPPADSRTRERLTASAKSHGWTALHRRLAEVDPKSAARIHPNDPQRIQRALEVFELTGRTLSQAFSDETPRSFPFQVIPLIVSPTDRTVLHERITERFHGMLGRGLVEEVIALHRRDELHPELPSIRAVGYRQVWQFLDGHIDYPTMVERAIIATRQLAKRQLTWLRSNDDAAWFDSDHESVLAKISTHVCNALVECRS